MSNKNSNKNVFGVRFLHSCAEIEGVLFGPASRVECSTWNTNGRGSRRGGEGEQAALYAMGCAGSMAAVHPVPHEETIRQPDGCAKDVEIASLRTENTSLKKQLARGEGGETAKDAEIASLQEQLAHTFDSLRAQIATLHDQLARTKSDGKSPAAQKRGKKARADWAASNFKEGAEEAAWTDTLELSEFARGLQQSLCAAVVEGLVLGLGLASPDDPLDVAATLRALHDNGDLLIRQHCVPLMIQTMTDNLPVSKSTT